MSATFGIVVLTQGDRTRELHLGLESLLRQRGVDLDIVVVGNGCEPAGLPAGVGSLALAVNVGATAGRNAGVPGVRGELLLFLDDDARLPDDDALERIAGAFAARPRLGVLQPRVADPAGASPPRHWVPRLRVGDPARSSEATTVWEGAVAMRRRAFDEVGGWPEEFFYLHEGVDLAWRALDADWEVWYAGDVLALHPALPAVRHGLFHYVSARNRVWLARRHLPVLLGAVYVTVWLLRTGARLRTRADARETLRGYGDGLTQPCGTRRRLRWRTLWRMTLAGRPPLV
ncbi:MAG: glycosyltransferase [Actinomycetota bacterium]|nr:glycosyltransferase [Actinomycetota bacterium]